MDIPAELRERWATRDRKQTELPVIASIDILEYAPALPVLDSLEEEVITTPPPPAAPISPTARPLIETIKLYDVQKVGPQNISLSTYAPSIPAPSSH